MDLNKKLVSLVVMVAFAILLMGFATASVTISDVEVSGVSGSEFLNVGAVAGETLPVRVFFTSTENLSDVRVRILVSGADDSSVTTGEFVVFPSVTYSRLMSVTIPSKLDFPNEKVTLEIRVESDGVERATKKVVLSGQREEYNVQFLDVDMNTRVTAGEALSADIVLKNRGFEISEDTFVRVSIPALGIEKRSYFSDLTPVDQDDPDKEDAAAGRISLSIPANTPAGIYTIQFDVFNDDTSTSVTKKVAVVSSSTSSMVVSPSNEKKFSVGGSATYSVTVVNSGNKIKLYTLSIDSPDKLSVESDETVFAVPAGSSKTVQIKATADEAGKYNFVVSINSDGELVKAENFMANVEGNAKKENAGNATVVLTVVLAIIFVVLLVVLIVLLTRKPQKSEEFGESYY